MTQSITRQCQTIPVHLPGTVLSDLRIQGSQGTVYPRTCLQAGSLPCSGTAQSSTQPLRSHPWHSCLRFLSVCSGGRARLTAACCCCCTARPGQDGHGSGRLTAGTAGLWQLSAMCRWHSLPFSRSGESPEIPDCGLWPQQLCSEPTAGGNDGSLFNSLLQKTI